MVIEDIFKKLTFTNDLNIVTVGNRSIVEILSKDYLKNYSVNTSPPEILKEYLYHAEYQNRTSLLPLTDSQKAFRFVFNDKRYAAYDKKNFWRNANWAKTNTDNVIDKVYLKKGYEARLVPIGRFIEDDYFFSADNPNIPKKVLSIHHPAYELRDGYVFIRGQEFLEVGSVGLIRFYFNLNFNHPEFEKLLHELIIQLQTKFDIRSIPFYLKFFEKNDTQQYERADNFIVYAEKRHYKIIINLILSIYKSLDNISKIYADTISIFRDKLPLFVKQIPNASGLGFAEEPNLGINNSEEENVFFDMDYSFGQRVCWTLAESFWIKQDSKDMQEIYNTLKKKGVKKQGEEWMFYLNPNSDNSFYFDKSIDLLYINSDTFLKINNIDEASWLGYSAFNNKKYLLAAIQIFYKILKEVIWIDSEKATLVGYNKEKEYKIILTSNFEEGLAGVNVFLQSVVSIYPDDNATKTLDGINAYLKQENSPKQVAKFKTDFKDQNLDFAIEYFYFRMYGINYFPNNYFTFNNKEKVNFNDNKVFKIADNIIETYLINGLPFPNGYDGDYEFSPSINFGLAGIGSFFLSLYDFSLPNRKSFLESTSSE